MQTIRRYVHTFFGCKECGEHFEEMAKESMDSVKTADQAVLWLWRKHNMVNSRLAGERPACPPLSPHYQAHNPEPAFGGSNPLEDHQGCPGQCVGGHCLLWVSQASVFCWLWSFWPLCTLMGLFLPYLPSGTPSPHTHTSLQVFLSSEKNPSRAQCCTL